MKVPLAAATALIALLVAPAVSGTPHGARSDDSEATAPTSTSLAGASASEYGLHLDFDGGTSASPDLSSSGSAAASSSVATADGGRVLSARRGSGQALRLEPFDAEPPAKLAVVVVRPDSDQDPFAPRRGGFVFGATFALDAKSQGSDVDNGNNLVQRGLYNDDAQYKVQVDGGRVSCRVSGSAGAVLVKASTAVKAGRWHRVRCTREADSVTLVLVENTPDGPVTRKWTRSGAIGDLAFSARPPLSIGGKVDRSGAVMKASSDQFNGRVDNVFFRRLGG